MMTALLLHGYASGIYFSHRIAKAAVERADFVMIVAGDLPDSAPQAPSPRASRFWNTARQGLTRLTRTTTAAASLSRPCIDRTSGPTLPHLQV
jgi:hypothetical protein